MTLHYFKLPLPGLGRGLSCLRIGDLGTRLRVACAAVALAASAVPTALAAPTPTFSWAFAPGFHQSGPSGAVDVRGTLRNTGSETIDAINYLVVYIGSLGPHMTAWTWNPTFWQDYYNANSPLDIDPGETFDFYIGTLAYDDAPAGLYTAVTNVAIGVLSHDNVYSGPVAPGNALLVQVPEPSVAALAAAALLGLGLVRRRRPGRAD